MIGTTLRGRYKVIRKLGHGAFGETYLAQDMDLPGKPLCVVKLLKPLRRDPFVLQTAIRLFDREAQVLYRLGNQHDQIPRLLAHFEENLEFYLVQEFIDGNDLSKELISGRQWSQEQVIAFLQDVLKTLEFVHQQNVIHRDIKPANLIKRASDSKIVLIDFGAVKEVTTLMANMEVVTVIGTPGYMPNEQHVGNPKFNSDIYSLGMICIQVITGNHPRNLPKYPEVIWNKQVVSPQLAAILDKMVCIDFQMRYQSATEVLQALTSLTEVKNQGSLTKKILLAFGLAVIIFSFAVLTPKIRQIVGFPYDNTSTNVDFLIYQNPTYGINIKYPNTWMKQEKESALTNDVAKFSLPPKSGSNSFPIEFTVEIQDLKQPTSLPDYTNSQIKVIQQFLTNAKIYEQHPTTLANILAEEVVYTGKDEQYIVKRMAVWTLKNNRAYIITYTAEESEYDKFLKTAQVMIHSLEIP